MDDVKVRMIVDFGNRKRNDEFMVPWFISQALIRDGLAVIVEEEENEDTTLIECSECKKEVFVENGTWALDKGMCELCYASYQGG